MMLSTAYKDDQKEVGDLAPNFVLRDQEGRLFRFSEHLQQPVVLFFYPMDYSPICTLEAIAFREAFHEFEELGATVVGISGDTTTQHKNFCESFHLPFSLLSDPGHEVRNLFGVRDAIGLKVGRVSIIVDTNRVIREIFVSRFRPNKHVESALETVKKLMRENERKHIYSVV